MRPVQALAMLLGAAALLGLSLPGQVEAQPKPEIKVKTPITVTYQLVSRPEGDLLAAKPSEGEEVTTPLGCTGQALRAYKGSLYVACGAEGLRVYTLADPLKPRLEGVRDLDGEVVGLFEQDGQIWARLSRTAAVPVSRPGGAAALTDRERAATVEVHLPTPDATPQPDTTPQPEPAPATPQGEVVEAGGGELVITLGTRHGVQKGHHVELYQEAPEDLGGGQSAVREDRLAVAEVITASEERAKLRLGLNESVPVGALARPTTRALTSSLVRPPRISGLYETSFVARPFFALGDFGVGMVSDASFGYRSENIHVLALLEPAGIGLAGDGNIVAFAGNLAVAYDTQMFEIGLGLGWSAVNDSIEDSFAVAASDSGGGVTPPEFDRVRSGLSIAQLVRLGAVDGFNLTVHNTFLVFDDQFNYGGTTAALQIPVADRSWLLARGGGGVAGYAYGELGLRVLVRGNGGSGSIFITPSLGGAGLFGEKETTCTGYNYDPNTGGSTTYEYTCVEEISYGGPMVGFGMEFRH